MVLGITGIVNINGIFVSADIYQLCLLPEVLELIFVSNADIYQLCLLEIIIVLFLDLCLNAENGDGVPQ